MGSSCSCNHFSELKQELDILKEQKRNQDFFLDNSIDNINKEDNNQYDIKLKKLPSYSNDLAIFSSQSHTNNNNNIFQNESSNFDSNAIIMDKIKDKDIIEEKEIIIENNNIKNENDKEIKKEKNQIKLKPKKKIILNNNDNGNYEYDEKNKNIDNGFKNNETKITKYNIIYSSSINIITNKNNEDDIISDDEYNYSPEDKISKIIFYNINKLRKNPKEIADLIEKNKKFIIIDEKNNIFFKKNSIKYKLEKGYPIFEETINILNNLEPMNQLIYNKDITIKIPNIDDKFNNIDYLNNQIEELQKNGNHIYSYWSETIQDPEIAFLMMTIDDNNIKSGLKRKDLINPAIKYIGIISFQNNNNSYCYITLSTRK